MAFRLWCHQFILNSSTSSNCSWTKPFICTPQGLAELKTWRRNDPIQDQNMPASRRLHFTFLAKGQKKKVTHLSWGRFSSLAPWLGMLCAGLLEQFAQIESKAQLFAEVSTSFWNTSGHGAKGRAAHAAKGLALLWALLAALSPASGQDRMESGHLRNSPIDRCEDLSHAHCWGELWFAARVSNLDTYIRCTCVDLTQAHI